MKYKVYIEGKPMPPQEIDEGSPSSAAENYMAWLNPADDCDVYYYTVTVETKSAFWRFKVEKKTYYQATSGGWSRKQ